MRTLREILELMLEGKTLEDFLKIRQSLDMEVYGRAKITNSAEHQDRPVILVDFDGVINSYTSGFNLAEIPDDPVPGAIDWLAYMTFCFEVRIFSARCNDKVGIETMRRWLHRHGLEPEYLQKLIFEPGKPSHHIIIDDRAIQFTGSFAELELSNIQTFRPWNRRPKTLKNPLEK